MAQYKLVVLSGPRNGRDDEYNSWYNDTHLDDVIAVPGFKCAQRFKLSNDMGFEHKHEYLALYEVETDDPEAAINDLLSRQGTEAMYISEALDLEGAVAGLFEPCSDVVSADGMRTD